LDPVEFYHISVAVFQFLAYILFPCIRFIHDVLHVNIYLHLHFWCLSTDFDADWCVLTGKTRNSHVTFSGFDIKMLVFNLTHVGLLLGDTVTIRRDHAAYIRSSFQCMFCVSLTFA